MLNPLQKSSVSVEYASLETADRTELVRHALSGDLRSSSLRSVYWKLFLGCLKPCQSTNWPDQLNTFRQEYGTLKQRHLVDPRAVKDVSPLVNHPLSQDSQSPWQQFWEVSNVEAEIRQDVERAFPENDFFRDREVQAKMIRILLVWSRVHSQVSYRQGMHELLGPFLYLLAADSEGLARRRATEDVGKIEVLIDEAYIEHDAYAMFNRLMDYTAPTFARPTGPNAVNNVVRLCKKLHYELLQEYDHEVFRHLERMSIEPQLYSLRWFRLLLVREFHLIDVLVVWDAILATIDHSLTFVTYLCLAMLFYIRRTLLEGDYTTCMKRLMTFPPVEDVHVIVEQAIDLQNGQKRIPSPLPPPMAAGPLDPLSGPNGANNLQIPAQFHKILSKVHDKVNDVASLVDSLSPRRAPTSNSPSEPLLGSSATSTTTAPSSSSLPNPTQPHPLAVGTKKPPIPISFAFDDTPHPTPLTHSSSSSFTPLSSSSSTPYSPYSLSSAAMAQSQSSQSQPNQRQTHSSQHPLPSPSAIPQPSHLRGNDLQSPLASSAGTSAPERGPHFIHLSLGNSHSDMKDLGLKLSASLSALERAWLNRTSPDAASVQVAFQEIRSVADSLQKFK